MSDTLVTMFRQLTKVTLSILPLLKYEIQYYIEVHEVQNIVIVSFIAILKSRKWCLECITGNYLCK